MQWFEPVRTFLSSIINGLKGLQMPGGIGIPVWTFLAGCFCFKILISVMKTLLGISPGMSGLRNLGGDIAHATGSVSDAIKRNKDKKNKGD